MALKEKGRTKQGTPVYCSFDELVPLEEVTPNPENPNTHPTSQVNLLVKVIQGQGWRQPITVSNLSGLIVRGHARLMAAEQIGEEDVPVDFQDYNSEAEEFADLVADNRLAELAEIDRPMLKDLINDRIDTGELDLEMTGYFESEIEDLMTQYHIDDLEAEGEFTGNRSEHSTNKTIVSMGNMAASVAIKKVDALQAYITANWGEEWDVCIPAFIDYLLEVLSINEISDGDREQGISVHSDTAQEGGGEPGF